MKKKDYENKNINDLTAGEASHMYIWIRVKAFFIVSLICTLITAYVGLCAYLAIENRVDDIIREQDILMEKFENDMKNKDKDKNMTGDAYDLPQIYLDDMEYYID